MTASIYSNLRTVEVHKNSVIIAPGTPINDAIKILLDAAERSTCSRQEGYDLGGPFDFASPWEITLREMDAAIGTMKRRRAEFQEVAHHIHEWGHDDYCRICGADGRA